MRSQCYDCEETFNEENLFQSDEWIGKVCEDCCEEQWQIMEESQTMMARQQYLVSKQDSEIYAKMLIEGYMKANPVGEIMKKCINQYLWLNGDYIHDIDEKQEQYSEPYGHLLSHFLHNGFHVNGFG